MEDGETERIPQRNRNLLPPEQNSPRKPCHPPRPAICVAVRKRYPQELLENVWRRSPHAHSPSHCRLSPLPADYHDPRESAHSPHVGRSALYCDNPLRASSLTPSPALREDCFSHPHHRRICAHDGPPLPPQVPPRLRRADRLHHDDLEPRCDHALQDGNVQSAPESGDGLGQLLPPSPPLSARVPFRENFSNAEEKGLRAERRGLRG